MSATLTYKLLPNFPGDTGLAASVVAKIYDAATDTLRATVNTGWSEILGGDGNGSGMYAGSVSLNIAWLPCYAIYTITGSAGAAAETIGLDAAVVALVGTGLSGPSSVTLAFEDSNGNPVPFVQFSLAGITGQANGSGVASFGFPNGSYTVVAAPTNGVTFAPAALTVGGTTALTIQGATAAIPSSPVLGDVNVFGYVLDQTGTGMGGVSVLLALIAPPQAILTNMATKQISNAEGYFSFSLPQNQNFQFTVGTSGTYSAVLNSGTGATYELPPIFGTY
jgi:hypothetical protein